MKQRILAILLLCSVALFGSPVQHMQIAVIKKQAAGGGLTPEVAWLKFNDGSGATAVDDVSNNDGTITGTPSWNVGSLNLNGTTNLVTLANEGNFDLERDETFSISIWVNQTATSGTKYIFAKHSLAGNQPGIYIFIDTDNALLKAILLDNGGNTLTAEGGVGSFTDDTLHHIAVTYDGSSSGAGLLLYVDGALYDTGTGTISQTILNNEPAVIGANSFGAALLPGLVDDFRVYDRVLSSGEVTTLSGAPE